MNIITADRFNELKSEVKAECLRRKYVSTTSGSVSVESYGGTDYDYSTTPADDVCIKIEHKDKNVVPLAVINSDNVPATGATVIQETDMAQMEAFVTLCKAQAVVDKTASNNTCKGGCTGMCYSVCTGECSGTCSGTCSGGCSTTCSGGCSGGCKGDCDGTCSGGCDGDCDGTCTGGCDTTCTGGCSTGCTGYCGAACEANCRSDGCFASGCTNCDGSCTITCAPTCTSPNYSAGWT